MILTVKNSLSSFGAVALSTLEMVKYRVLFSVPSLNGRLFRGLEDAMVALRKSLAREAVSVGAVPFPPLV